MCNNTFEGKNGFEIPDGFYGNAFAYTTVLSKAGQLCRSPLGHALELVKKAKAMMSKEYMHSTADLLATKGRPRHTTVWNFLVADASRVELEQIDFGWGKPVYAGVAYAFPLLSIYVRYENTKGEVGVMVPVWLPPVAMSKLRKEVIRMIGGPDEEFADSNLGAMASKL